MRRRPQPVTRYAGHEAYPSGAQEWLSRRGFLKAAAGAAAAAAVGAAGAGEGARAAPQVKDKRQRVTVHLDRYHQIGGSGLRADKVVVFTDDKKLARFLRKYSNQRRVRRALMRRVKKVKAKTLYDGKKLYRLERALGAIVRKEYRKATKRSVVQPDVMLSVTRYWRYRRTAGIMIRPTYRPRPSP